jgi:catechol 2,3-dioxygenase-like lactoylglutathione lyase family enzyme
MLASKDAMATIAVKDIAAARKFYEGKLGFERTGVEQPGMVAYQSGKTLVMVYESQFAGTNQATAATWNVGEDLERAVKMLGERGVTFEHYDLPGMKREGDIHVCADMKVAWFKDPDGNILNIAGR